MPTIGWMGTGTMGYAMAENALQAGYSLRIYNRSKEKAAPLLEKGAIWAPTPAAAVAGVDVVWIMLADDAAIRDVFTGETGILSAISSGVLVIDSSTVSPATSMTIGKLVAEKGAEFLDAPVSGSRPHAEQAALTFMVGGTQQAYEKATPYFDVLGKKSFYLGEQGAGINRERTSANWCKPFGIFTEVTMSYDWPLTEMGPTSLLAR